jgi:hypothetical protein
MGTFRNVWELLGKNRNAEIKVIFTDYLMDATLEKPTPTQETYQESSCRNQEAHAKVDQSAAVYSYQEILLSVRHTKLIVNKYLILRRDNPPSKLNILLQKQFVECLPANTVFIGHLLPRLHTTIIIRHNAEFLAVTIFFS